jgi:hypothetical protein
MGARRLLDRAPPRQCKSSRIHQFSRDGDKFSQSAPRKTA